MDLFETLKEFKKLEPGKEFTENSRRVILAHEPIHISSSHRILVRGIAISSSLVLAGALIFIVAGGLSATKLAPRFSSIDPTALRAEAQAIDTQINLLNIDYAENSVSTKQTTSGKPISAGKTAATSSPLLAPSGTSSSTPTSTLSVDAILQQLSQ